MDHLLLTPAFTLFLKLGFKTGAVTSQLTTKVVLSEQRILFY